MDNKKLSRNTFILVLLTCGVVFFVIKDDFNAIQSVFLNANLLSILAAIGIHAGSVFLAAFVLRIWLKENISLKQSFISLILASFARGVTPFASGGQAMQIYVLKKYGVKIEDSVFALSVDFLIYQLTLILVSLGLVFLYGHHFKQNAFLYGGIITGLIASFGILVVMSVLALWKRLQLFTIQYIIRGLAKIKVIKNESDAIKIFKDKVDHFSKQLRVLPQHKKSVLVSIVSHFMNLMLFHSVTYLLVFAFNISLENHHYLMFIAYSIFVSMFNAFIPIPGGTGGIEAVFTLIFGTLIIPESYLKSLLLGWRFVTFYFPILFGSIAFVMFNRKYTIEGVKHEKTD